MILIVDDEIPLARIYARQLIVNGYTTEYVGGADEALAFINLRRPDVAIIDIGLSGNINGIELLQLMRQAGYTGPAIAMSGYTKHYKDEALQEFKQVLQKPLPLIDLLGAVSPWVQSTLPSLSTIIQDQS